MASLVAAACASAASAQRNPLATRGGWEVGIHGSSYTYDEPGIARLEGERLGLSGSYTAVNEDAVYARIEGRYSYGELDYTGSGALRDVPDYAIELRALTGRDYRAGRVVWIPYVGFGYRYLYNDLRGVTSTRAVGYRRESRYYYLPIGLTLRLPLRRNWTFAPQIEYDAFVDGRQRSHLGDTGLGLSDVTNRQRRGRGARGQLALEGPRWAVSLWVHYWKVKKSDLQSAGRGVAFEPLNSTRESGIELRYLF